MCPLNFAPAGKHCSIFFPLNILVSPWVEEILFVDIIGAITYTIRNVFFSLLGFTLDEGLGPNFL
jgi:hypothetical protein